MEKLRAAEQVRAECIEVLKGRDHLLSPLKGDTLTITGGTGFLGTWLTELVTTLNDRHGFNTQLVLISRGVDHFRKQRPHLANRKDVKLIKSDVRHTFEIPKETNWLIHAGANPDSRFHATYPVETMTVIANGTEAILHSVDRCSSFKMFMNVSSGLVYGPQPWNLDRIKEDYAGGAPLGALSSGYAEAKRYSELLCTSFRHQARLPVVNVRPFAFIGPYQSLESPWAVNNFIQDAISGRPIRVLGDGQTVRSYMYPTDLVYWLARILTGAQSGSNYNVGSPDPVSLGQLAERVASHFTPRSEILFSVGAATTQSRSRFVPDVSAAHEAFGLEVTVPLETALTRTIQWNRAASE